MKNKYALFHINIAVLLFGVTGLFAKSIALPALTITFGRVLFSAMTLLIVSTAGKSSLKLKSLRHFTYFIIAGIILALHWWSFLYAIQLSSVAIGTIAFSTFPLFVTLLSAIMFKEPWQKRQIIMCLLIILGIILTVPAFSFENRDLQGLSVGLFSALTYALLTLLNKYFSVHYSGVTISFYEQASSTVVLLPVLFLPTAAITLHDIFLLIILGVLCTALAHTLFISSLKSVSSHLACMISTLESVYIIFFAFLFLQEIPAIKEIAGALIITGTVIISQLIESGGNQNGT